MLSIYIYICMHIYTYIHTYIHIRKFYQYTHNNPFVEPNAPEIVDLSSSLRGELLRLFRKVLNLLALLV